MHPSIQPPFGTESICPPTRTARSTRPGAEPLLPAASIDSSAPVLATLSRSHSLARSRSRQGHALVRRSRSLERAELLQLRMVRFGSSATARSNRPVRVWAALPMRSRKARAARVAVLGLVLVRLWSLWGATEAVGVDRLDSAVPVNATTMPPCTTCRRAVVDPEEEPFLPSTARTRLFTAKEAAWGSQSEPDLMGFSSEPDRAVRRAQRVMPYSCVTYDPDPRLTPIVVVVLVNVSIVAGRRRMDAVGRIPRT